MNWAGYEVDENLATNFAETGMDANSLEVKYLMVKALLDRVKSMAQDGVQVFHPWGGIPGMVYDAQPRFLLKIECNKLHHGGRVQSSNLFSRE